MKKIIGFDMLINIFLGLLLVIFPGFFSKLIFVKNNPDLILIIIVGVSLFIFGIWQIYILRKGVINLKVKKFLGVMALAPALVLTLFLVFYACSTSKLGFISLAIGNIYMFLLSIYYFRNSQKK